MRRVIVTYKQAAKAKKGLNKLNVDIVDISEGPCDTVFFIHSTKKSKTIQKAIWNEGVGYCGISAEKVFARLK